MKGGKKLVVTSLAAAVETLYNKGMKCRILTCAACAASLIIGMAAPCPVSAQNSRAYTGAYDDVDESRALNQALKNSRQFAGVTLQIPYRQPAEPGFEKVTYLKQEPCTMLRERIERLIHGIYVDIPPEYDHYGYEIRRYMAHIGGQDVLNSSHNIRAQLKNIKNAQIILKYWREAVNKEAEAIEAEIGKTTGDSSIRSSLKYHRGVAQAFFTEAASWMRNNQGLLEYLDGLDKDTYEFAQPTMVFNDTNALRHYAALLKARDKSLKQMQEYAPFIKMVY